MRKPAFRCLKVLVLILTLILGQSSTSFALDSKDQKPAAKSEPKLVQTATASGVAYGGEGGGPNSLRCPESYVMTGISDSNFVAATNWYNVGLAITCTKVELTASGSIYLTQTSSKTPVFVFNSYTANRDSICSSGNAITTVRVYTSGNGFVQDVGADCKGFPSQTNSESIAAANGSNWTYITPSLSTCSAGSFATGVYGRNGEGIDKLGVYCSAFSVGSTSVSQPAFESYLQRDLVLMSNPALTRFGDVYLCSAGSYGYKWSKMPASSAEKTELDSVTMILKVDKKIVGVASSDDFKSLPRWIFGIEATLSAAKVVDGNVIWVIPGSAKSSDVVCEIAALK